jgi:alkanesulfonate monooxygenase SsuD/methylene tetrahydromethanopterin reductase-like flavin-dependent oxidoreductase (luciferase family)
MVLYRDRGEFIPMESPEDVLATDFNAAQENRIQAMTRDAFVGEAPKVAGQIEALGKELGVDERSIVTWSHSEAVRHRSYELLADSLGVRATAGEAA